MYKKAAWRNEASDAVSFHQDQALHTTIFLLRSYGPTRFLLQEHGEAKHFKVCLGDLHTCSCLGFHRDRELCKHICWVLMRKFRLPRDHEYCFQRGLGERQIAELLQGSCGGRGGEAPQTHSSSSSSVGPGTPCEQAADPQEDGRVRQKSIQAQDVCPICQEGLLEKRLPVAHCRFGCGNNVHISCMKVWADHQTGSEGEPLAAGHPPVVRCPLCREAFSSLALLEEQVKNAAALHTAAEREKPQVHLGVVCRGCRVCPVTGKCFKCMVCSYYYLCEACVKNNCHPQHQLVSRTKRRDKWQYAEHCLVPLPDDPGTTVTPQPADDSGLSLPARVLECLPTVRVRMGSRLLCAGQQCRICLQSFGLGQHVRTLPCRHKFHAGCVDGVLQASNSCPLDGYVVYSPGTPGERKKTPGSSSSKLQASRCAFNSAAAALEKGVANLFVPGVSLAVRAGSRVPHPPAMSLQVLPRSLIPGNAPEEDLLTDNGVQGLRVNTVGRNTETQREERHSPHHFVFPRRTYTFNEQGKHPSSDRHNSAPSHKTLERRGVVTSAHGPALVVPPHTGQRARRAGLFVGSKRPELERHDGTAFAPVVPAWGTSSTRVGAGPAVLRADRKDRPPTELTMTGVLMNTQQWKKK